MENLNSKMIQKTERPIKRGVANELYDVSLQNEYRNRIL